MGVDITFYVVFGVKIPLESFYRDVQKRVCDHPDFNSAFCPECGKEKWWTDKEFILKDRYSIEDRARKEGLVFLLDNWYDGEKGSLYIGLGDSINEGDGSRKMNIPNSLSGRELYNRIVTFCKKENIPVPGEETFSAWMVVYAH